MSIHVNNFLLASNTMASFDAIKAFLVKEYDTKNLGEVKIIIE